MSRLQSRADLAFGFEAADAGTVARARIDNDEGPLAILGDRARRRSDFDDPIVHRLRQRPAVHDHLMVELQHMGNLHGHLLQVLVSAPTHHIPVQHGSLAGVHQVRNKMMVTGKWIEFYSFVFRIQHNSSFLFMRSLPEGSV